MAKYDSHKPDKKFYFNSILVILLVLVTTGFLLALVVNFMHGKFSPRLIKISIINTLALSGGVVLNFFVSGRIIRRFHPAWVFPSSLVIISGVTLTGFFYIFLLEPLFFCMVPTS